MDRLLSVSQGARMVGVPRKLLQQHIQDGRVMTFEGYIRLSELKKAYPDATTGKKSGILEKVRLIQDAAMHKGLGDKAADPEQAAMELHRAKIEIAHLKEQLNGYKDLAATTENRLLEMQARCDKKQSMILGTFVGWYMNQVKLHS